MISSKSLKRICEFKGIINGDNISQFLSLSYIMLLLPNIKTSCKQITADNFKTIFKNIWIGIELTWCWNTQFSICITVKPMERCMCSRTNKYTWTQKFLLAGVGERSNLRVKLCQLLAICTNSLYGDFQRRVWFKNWMKLGVSKKKTVHAHHRETR